MPIYDFYCPQCQQTFEELASPDKTAPCPHCGSNATERRVSAPSPLKTGAFPYKVGPLHPLAKKMAASAAGGAGGCGAAGGCGGAGGGFS